MSLDGMGIGALEDRYGGELPPQAGQMSLDGMEIGS